MSSLHIANSTPSDSGLYWVVTNDGAYIGGFYSYDDAEEYIALESQHTTLRAAVKLLMTELVSDDPEVTDLQSWSVVVAILDGESPTL